MLPNKECNIYPWTKENISALLIYYLNVPDGDIEFVYTLNNDLGIELNQFELIVRSIYEHIEFFERNLGNSGMTKSNLIRYGLDAFALRERVEFGSGTRTKITLQFRKVAGIV